jgi:pimeloyl-ACP methyl ester carboxylesterase
VGSNPTRRIVEARPISTMQFTLAPSDSGEVLVGGCSIAWAAWGAVEAPVAVLVHGAGAHMGWWDSVITELAGSFRVIAFDLSGNGDSAARDDYDGGEWAEEVLAVARQVGGGRVLLVGHSLGGRISILAAARAPEIVRGLVLVDAPIRRPGTESRQRFVPRSSGRRYETLEQAAEAFHLKPPEPILNHDLLRRVAAGAYRRTDDGWSLKSDPNVYGRIDDATVADSLAEIDAPITMVYGGRSMSLDDDGRAFLVEAHPGPTELVGIEDGFHHLTFDYGPEVALAVRELSSTAP